MLGDRLWDDEGQVWYRDRGEWADAEEVERHLASACRVVLHGFRRPMQWLTSAEAAARWRQIRPHCAVPGQYGADGDAEGLTYAAVLWRRGDRQLLGFEVFC
ncbi:hypothetical protein FraQA3DRAFT_5248 [Frankia sp. QA3]|nr:hypothetical protein FraQA3DRAFT_5248 [Frankia sp. QA3]